MLVALAFQGEQEYSRGKGQRLRDLVGQRFSVYGGQMLVGKLPARAEPDRVDLHAKERRYVQGPSTNGGSVVPLVTVDFRSSPGPEFLCLQVILCVKHDDELMLSGFRYETPNPPGQEHDFCHAQPVRMVRGDPGENLDVPDWYSDETPTFPLNAVDCGGLCRAMLQSLYNTAKVDDISEAMRTYMYR